jgi:hypothetical protein
MVNLVWGPIIALGVACTGVPSDFTGANLRLLLIWVVRIICALGWYIRGCTLRLWGCESPRSLFSGTTDAFSPSWNHITLATLTLNVLRFPCAHDRRHLHDGKMGSGPLGVLSANAPANPKENKPAVIQRAC